MLLPIYIEYQSKTASLGACLQCDERSSDEFKIFGWSSWSCIRDSKGEEGMYFSVDERVHV